MSAIDWVSGNVICSFAFAHLEAEDESNDVDSLDSDNCHTLNEVLGGFRANAEG
jgi:hypothetical protein